MSHGHMQVEEEITAHAGRMSALGQKQTSNSRPLMSALPPKADIVQHGGNVRFVPEADIDLVCALEQYLFRSESCLLRRTDIADAGRTAEATHRSGKHLFRQPEHH